MLHRQTFNVSPEPIYTTIKSRDGYVNVVARIKSGALGFDIDFNERSELPSVKVTMNHSVRNMPLDEMQQSLDAVQQALGVAKDLKEKIELLRDPEEAILMIGEQLDTDSISNAVLSLSLMPNVLSELKADGNWNSHEAQIDLCFFDAVVRCRLFEKPMGALSSLSKEDYDNTPTRELPIEVSASIDFIYGLFAKLPCEKNPIADAQSGYGIIEVMLGICASIRNGQSILDQ